MIISRHFFAAFSRRFSSASTASRMNSAMRFGPANASIRFRRSSVSRTIVGFVMDVCFRGGRPMRRGVTDCGKFVKVHQISDCAY